MSDPVLEQIAKAERHLRRAEALAARIEGSALLADAFADAQATCTHLREQVGRIRSLVGAST